jgi:secreted effector protein SseD
MATIQSSTAVYAGQGVAQPQPNPTQNSYDFESAAESIEQLIFLVQKLNIDMRDIERKFAGKMMVASFDREVAAISAKRDAILKSFDASITHAVGEIAAGGLGAGGSILTAATGSEALGGISASAGKGVEGAADIGSAFFKRSADTSQLNGEIQEKNAKLLDKAVEDAIERTREASRQLIQATKDLVELQGRIQDAVRF